MIRAHRRLHLRIWLCLTPTLAVLFALALSVRVAPSAAPDPHLMKALESE